MTRARTELDDKLFDLTSYLVKSIHLQYFYGKVFFDNFLCLEKKLTVN